MPTTDDALFADDSPERVEGEVSFVVYADPASGFGVVSLDVEGQGTVKASGPLASVDVGQAISVVGRFTEHPKHGRTFDADFYELAAPKTKAGLRAFLASDRFPGVGEVLADRLVRKHGMKLGEVISDDPDSLTQLKGVSPALAARIHQAWRSAGMLPELVQRLAVADLGPPVARAAVRRFGDEALELLDDDPYAYLTLPGVRWVHADALGRAAGIDADDPRRLAAGAAGFLRGLCGRDGHTVVAAEELTTRLPAALGGGTERATAAIAAAIAVGTITRETHPLPDLPTDRLADTAQHEAEREIARAIEELSSPGSGRRNPMTSAEAVTPGDDEDAAPDVDADAVLTRQQEAAVERAMRAGVSVLTGGPGTGKTYAVTELVRRAHAAGAEVALCAPTGRAAKRLEEVTGHAATTVHRLLEARPDPDGGFVFMRGEANPLPQDLIVADEWSMADIHLAAALLESTAPPTHVVFVGDPDQLPPVGPGAVLRDLMDAGTIPVTRLDEVHRQAAQSRIVTLAHELNEGGRPTVVGREGDVFAVPERTEGVAERVADIVARSGPAFFDCQPADIQVLAAMYKGPAGVDALNTALKERLNPAADRTPVVGWHEGDRVVATRNDPEADIANGDIGEVAATDRAARSVTVAFPQGEVTLEGDRAATLAPAWCLTVHKSQGGEWPVVVLVLDPRQRSMLTRELVYTAVTRARRGLLLVGEVSLLTAAATRASAGLRARRTTLGARLAQISS